MKTISKRLWITLLVMFAMLSSVAFSSAVQPVQAAVGGVENYEDGSEDAVVPAAPITVYFTVSDDCSLVTKNGDESVKIANVPITVSWFDLSEYGLENLTLKDTSGNVIKQPTMLHALIRFLETYYNNGNKLTVGGQALSISGSSGSAYMTQFYGMDDNLTYFVNNEYPLQKAGWGDTLDHIQIKNGDVIDMAHYSDRSFWMTGQQFMHFSERSKTVQAQTPFDLTLFGSTTDWNSTYATTQEPLADAKIKMSTDNGVSWTENYATTDASGKITVSFDKPGTYWLMNQGNANYDFYGPAVSVITVEEAPAPETYSVTFDSQGGSDVTAQTVTDGSTASEPAAPTRDQYSFTGWYTDSECTTAYDFSSPVTADTILYAGWSENPTVTPSVVYQGHVQDRGWIDWVADGQSAGTTGQCKRVEAIRVKIEGDDNLGVSYAAHVQDIGWMDAVSDGALAGTEGQCKRVEAFRMNLTGSDAKKYDIYYRVHAENIGWMNWAKNGEDAGTAGFCYRLEAIQIEIVPKGDPAPEASPANATDTSFIEACNIKILGQIENIGWGQGWQKANQLETATVGTTGKGLRIESFCVISTDKNVRLSYRAHVQDIGWQNWVSNGAMSGTVGQCKRVEAFELKADGLPEGLKLQYRAHVENKGWMDWVDAGQTAGTTGQSLRIEALQVRLVAQ